MIKILKTILKALVFSNYFIGFCATLLAIYVSNQLNIKNIPYIFYCCIFIVTVYIYTSTSFNNNHNFSLNDKQKWLSQYKKSIHISQAILVSLLACFCLILLPNIYKNLFLLGTIHWLMLLTIILATFLYFGFKNKNKTYISLRKFGLLKPFIIGYVWAGVTVIIPYFFSSLNYSSTIIFNSNLIAIYTNTFLFITALAILYDLKDVEVDLQNNIKTFAVKFGINPTIYYFIIPLVIIGFVFQIFVFNSSLGFRNNLFLNAIPVVATILLANSFKNSKPLFYHLALIDGLIFLKALIGLVN